MTESTKPAETARDLLRHAVAVVAYRGAKAIRGAPAEFAALKASATTRQPLEILAHINDLYDWALWMAKGEWKWNNSKPGPPGQPRRACWLFGDVTSSSSRGRRRALRSPSR